MIRVLLLVTVLPILIALAVRGLFPQSIGDIGRGLTCTKAAPGPVFHQANEVSDG